MTTNIQPVAKMEEILEETIEAEEVKDEVKPEPVKPPEVLKKPEPYIRPTVALPKEGAGRHPRNIPRY